MRLPLLVRPSALAVAACLMSVIACDPEAPPPRPPEAPVASAPVPAPSVVAPESPPLGRLPPDARPTHYAIVLRVDPARPRFEGVADIAVELDRARDVLWLHGRDLAVHRATLQPEGGPAVEVRYEQVSPSGVAAVRPAAPIGPGRFTVHLEYDAPFAGNDEALYALARGGDHYAYAQFEATDARRAFPCFDEPAFKAPFAVTLVVPHGLAALSNAREVSRAPEPSRAAPAEAWDRVVFAPTEKLPSYLLNFAVGPFDVVAAPDLPPSAVRHRPLPLRGIATRGRGPELAYALAHTGELVTVLETYFGSEYPYDKLDLLAVPDKSGAMENAGSLTFAEAELLIDPKGSSVDARFEFAATVGHELAHQWFGDLVTMPWWDDLWLNEAFATWMESRLVAAVRPELHPEIRALESAHTAMAADSLVSARKIRQEIADDNDIQSAFDAITYDKGGAVLSMFERWIGPERFQKGIRAYLGAHRFGTASATDLLGALSAAAGRDVAAPFRTFLDQPGLPFVDVSVACDGKPRLVVQQSRFLPVGSSGRSSTQAQAPSWQIPVCARYSDGKQIRETCALVGAGGDTIPLEACPAWVMPNADAAGYYRWSLAPADRAKLAAALPALTERERVSFARSLAADFASAKSPAADVLDALAPLAADPSSGVAGTGMDVVSTFARWLEGDPLHARVQAYADALLAPSYKAVGWGPKRGEAEDTGKIALRKSVLTFLAFTARDKTVRREAAARGRAYLGMDRKGHAAKARDDKPGVSPDLATLALEVAAEEGGAPAFQALVTALAAEEREIERRRLLDALGSVTDPDLAGRARALELDSRVHSNEVGRHILTQQLRRPQTRDAAWAFLTANVDKLLAKAPASWTSTLVYAGTNYCDAAHEDELSKLFAPRIAALEAGPRNLAGALEEMSLCIARRAAQEPSARAFFARKTKP